MKTLDELVLPIPSSHLYETAIVYEDGENRFALSYQDIEKTSRIVENELRGKRLVNRVIGIIVPSSQFLIPSIILGIMKAEGIFVYIDSELSSNKQKEQCSSAHANTIIVEGQVLFENHWRQISSIDILGTKFSIFQNYETKATMEDLWNCEHFKLAYIIFTSGTTGSSKAVKVPHSCIIPNIIDLRERLQINKDDAIFVSSPWTFDPSIVDLFLGLSSRLKLLLVSSKLKKVPFKLAQIIESNHVTLMQATPSLLLHFGSEITKKYILGTSKALRIMILGGETFPTIELLNSFRAPGNRTQFYNIYGVTEVSCWATIARIDCSDNIASKESKKIRLENEITLGEAMKDTVLEVRDDHGFLVEEGEGYLYVGGQRVCFVNEENPKNVKLPFFRHTGDIVYVKDKSLFFRGRRDNLVKRFGQRFHLDNVEKIALKSGCIRNACALLFKNRLFLCCAADPAEIVVQNVRDTFQRYALRHERPDDIMIFSSFPLSKHGKVDRRQLANEISHRNPISGSMENWGIWVASLWKNLTGSTSLDETSNFILCGGDSMSAVHLTNCVEEQLGIALSSLLDILLNQTWKDVTGYIEKELDHSTSLKSLKQNLCLRVETFQRAMSTVARSVTDLQPDKSFSVLPLWNYEMGKCIDSSPLIIGRKDAAVVYIGSHSHRFAAVNLKDGKQKWEMTLPDRIDSSAGSDLSGQTLFVGCYDGGLYCLDALYGKIIWKRMTGNTVKCSPVCMEDTVICGSHDKSLYCLEIETGNELWKTQFSQGSIFASPVCDVNKCVVYSASLDGHYASLCSKTGRILWTQIFPKPIFGTPALLGDQLFLPCVNGCLYCCCTENGEVLWSFTTSGPIFSSPCLVQEGGLKILFGCHDHQLYCLNKDGHLIWKKDCSSPVYSSPFAYQHSSGYSVVISCSTEGLLFVLDLETGQQLGVFQLPGQVFSSPVVYQNRIIVGCRDDRLYCLELALATSISSVSEGNNS